MATNIREHKNACRHVWRAQLTWLLLGVSAHTNNADPGIPPRVPWTNSRITGSPDPPLPYVTRPAFPNLVFENPVDISGAPGSDRLFVVEQAGKIFSFPCLPDVKSAELAVDLAKEIPGTQQVYAITFHPEFEKNRFCYVCYIKAPRLADGTHVARFRVTRTDPPSIDVSTEQTIITWLSGGHNGCCLRFGPDGYLYISTGDGEGPNPPDIRRTGQDLTDLLSSILRIDVDRPDPGRSYRIPSDNPFVGLKDARSEIWAYGFRNPWRMSFDRKTGDLWVGDVGWELWELLDRVQRGGNYGWAVMEGRQPANPEWPRGPTPILPPTIDHPHSESSSITDGLTYYGTRLRDLCGAHIYGDYDTGRFWGFRFKNGQVVDHRELADTTHRVVAFGEDQQGEFYVLDHIAGTIHNFVPNPSREHSDAFPKKLSETGLFRSVAHQVPWPGVIPYSINAPPWMDHAVATRFVAVPNSSAIQTREKVWTFPRDSVLVKTVSLEMKRGSPHTRRHLETQILHFDGQQWRPYTYKWNDAQTDAILLDANGDEQIYTIVDEHATGGQRRQTWRFSGRAECQRCHNKWSGPPLAFNTPQLNKPFDGADSAVSQLDVFVQLGLLQHASPTGSTQRLVNPHDAAGDIDARARSYLHVNCAHCHRMHAGSSVLSKMHFDLSLEETNMVDVRPSQGTFGIRAAKVIAPSDPATSVLLVRMAKLGRGRMPHISSTQVDLAGVRLIHDWITHLPENDSEDGPWREVRKEYRRATAANLERLRRNGLSASEQRELTQRLLSTTTAAMKLLIAVQEGTIPPTIEPLVVEQASRHQNVIVRDLFERFVPDSERIKRLGSIVEPEQILSLPGDSARGRRVFFDTAGVQCKNCHRVGNMGQAVGPDLTAIARQRDRAQLLESILEPSKRIEPDYLTYLAETRDGRLITGLVVYKDAHTVVLMDPQNKEIRIAANEIEQLVPQSGSLMPDLLVRDMTAQQLADLLEFLVSLK